MPKRSAEADEEAAETELAAAIAAAKAAPPDEEITGLGSGSAMVLFDVPGTKVKQYKVGKARGEKGLVLIYLCIRGLGEIPRLMLAECGAAYTHLASPMGESQAVSCEWRQRSPNGLTPVLSGLGIPRSAPISQSGTVVRFLAQRYGMAGVTELEGLYADVLFETTKDLKGKQEQITQVDADKTSGPKGPLATAQKIAALLESMPDPSDDEAALNFGQIALLNTLVQCEETTPGCVKQLLPALDAFRAAGEARPRISAYLKSPMRFPVHGEGYKFVTGPVKRSAFAKL